MLQNGQSPNISLFRVGLPPDPASRQRPCPFANLRLCEYLVSEFSSDYTHSVFC